MEFSEQEALREYQRGYEDGRKAAEEAVKRLIEEDSAPKKEQTEKKDRNLN